MSHHKVVPRLKGGQQLPTKIIVMTVIGVHSTICFCAPQLLPGNKITITCICMCVCVCLCVCLITISGHLLHHVNVNIIEIKSCRV